MDVVYFNHGAVFVKHYFQYIYLMPKPVGAVEVGDEVYNKTAKYRVNVDTFARLSLNEARTKSLKEYYH